ncbi:erythromycin esterase family protein [Kribbella sp. NPDC056861]|uniref:erythromycin esterase family protein n=1 Tax=Kribbella sp. NPDC056861 TaxID=3154857 RepID=UPI003425ED77
MSQDISEFVTASGELLGFGEPTHLEPCFGQVRNELVFQLAGLGFRSVALETDRVAALRVDAFVRQGVGSLDEAMAGGFSHGFGEVAANRELVSWLRDYNAARPADQQLAFHGFDASLETMSAPSPRPYLDHAREYLQLDLDLAPLVGADDQWSRTEAVIDPASSIGATPAADSLRVIADDLLIALYARAPELIAATSRDEWQQSETYLTAALGILRYHKECARVEADQGLRIARLSSLRDALMAQNLLAVRALETRRGPTFVFAHNTHLQRNQNTWQFGDTDVTLASAGAILSTLLDDRYTFVAGSLGRSRTIGLEEPAPGTYESHLQRSTPTSWSLTPAAATPEGTTRTDPTPQQGYFPLTAATIKGADAILHLSD